MASHAHAHAPTSGSMLVLLPAALYVASVAGWAFLELYAQSGFEHGERRYDWSIESLSDLGVDYRQVHPLKHYNVTSHRFAAQNYNFFQAGAIFAVAQLVLLYASRTRATQHTATLRTFRFLLTLLFAAGMLLLGCIHGGPREKFWKIIGWHWTGLALVSIAGNLNSILSALVATHLGRHESPTAFRALSLGLGMSGLYSFYRFLALPEWDWKTPVGLWQRGSIYPVLAWELLSAISIIVSTSRGGSSKPKRA
ncbi:uncharacterized protein MYCFIDRAFT_80895 [Pseudocercospora fijiensis CIRAD86]|uniref:DUF998 domain-containing protein n=1 Tax=Pseudocercospora fijiensis (strain CIRAD86) TaxID=383855 RepID=M3AMW9_PSEFD|nr:uncharacterized protein MYCFIDRAFT_80895 [Pseudocercospora fijiensis CIRAD86]EME78478.1 hypothetical protein MYCFIDRAFT_80895 [Pseudocercospora fijiensis CIRAD86]